MPFPALALAAAGAVVVAIGLAWAVVRGGSDEPRAEATPRPTADAPSATDEADRSAADDTGAATEPFGEVPPQLSDVAFETVSQRTGTGDTVVALANASLTVPAGAVPEGTLAHVSLFAEPPSGVDGTMRRSALPGPVDFAVGAPPDLAVTIALPVEVAEPESPVLVHFDLIAGTWLPVPGASFDPVAGTVSAEVEHLSLFDVIVDTASWAGDRIEDGVDLAVDGLVTAGSWASYSVANVLGNRAERPRCSGNLPDWVGALNVVDDRNAALLACGEATGDDLVVKVVANRGFSMTLEADLPFSTPPLATVDLTGAVSAAFHRALGNAVPGTGYVPAQSEAVLVFARPAAVPAAGAVVEVRGSVDAWSVLGDLLLKAFRGAGFPAEDYVQLFECGIAAIELSGEVAARDAVDVATEGIGALIDCTESVALGLNTVLSVTARQVLRAIDVFDFAANVADVTVDNLVDSAYFALVLRVGAFSAEPGGAIEVLTEALLGVPVGAPADEILNAVLARWGQPTADTGWTSVACRSVDRARIVSWGALSVDLLDDGSGDRFGGFGYDMDASEFGGPSADDFVFPFGIALGDPIEVLIRGLPGNQLATWQYPSQPGNPYDFGVVTLVSGQTFLSGPGGAQTPVTALSVGTRLLCGPVARALEGIVGLEAFLYDFGDTWLAGDWAAMAAIAAPEVVAAAEQWGPLDLFSVGWDALHCSMGSSAAGGCELLVLPSGDPGPALLFNVSYNERAGGVEISDLDWAGDAG